jgi:hypothetical protein
MNRRSFIKTTGGVIAASVGLAGCTGESASGSGGGGGGSGSGSEPTATQSQYGYAENGIGISSWDVYSNDVGNVFAGGEATNISDSELGYVQIQVEFLDSTDTRLQTGLANTNNLAAGQTWQWEAIYPGMDTEAVASARLLGIDAY